MKRPNKGGSVPQQDRQGRENPEGIPGPFLYLGGGTKSRVWSRQLRRLLSERQASHLFTSQPITGLRSLTLYHFLFPPVMEMFLKRPPRPLRRSLWLVKASKIGLDLVIVRGGGKKQPWICCNSFSAACWDCAHNVLWTQWHNMNACCTYTELQGWWVYFSLVFVTRIQNYCGLVVCQLFAEKTQVKSSIKFPSVLTFEDFLSV